MKLLKASTFVTILLLNALITLGIMSLRVQPVRGGAAGATKNGDVNCDDKIDISDAIHLLEWQFMGGSAPCALALDNYATKEELAALADQVAILKASAKRTASFAGGSYIGDGANLRNITTGLPGKLRVLWIYSINGTGFVIGGQPSSGFWTDTMSPTQMIGFAIQPDNSFNLIGGSANNANNTGNNYYWFALSTPE